MRSWRNWHTRTFEGRVREGTGSSPVDRTTNCLTIMCKAIFLYVTTIFSQKNQNKRKFRPLLYQNDRKTHAPNLKLLLIYHAHKRTYKKTLQGNTTLWAK